jgi:transcription initiation factor TFIIF subunit beta
MADPLIKPDPENQGASPGPFSEDDIYEDAGDLEFNTDPHFQKLYLARVPKFLWEAWEKLDDDAEIQIGTIRQTQTVVDGETKVCMTLSRRVLLLMLTSNPAISFYAIIL